MAKLYRLTLVYVTAHVIVAQKFMYCISKKRASAETRFLCQCPTKMSQLHQHGARALEKITAIEPAIEVENYQIGFGIT